MSLPFVINAFVGSNISANILAGAGWRWGYGMFAILVPAALLPLIITLLWAQRKAKKQGLIVKTERQGSILQKVVEDSVKLDILGLAILGTSVALILLPLTLAETADNGWKNRTSPILTLYFRP
jgi:MFS family permease